MFPAYTPVLNPGVTSADKNDIVLWLLLFSEALMLEVVFQACVRNVQPLMIIKESTVEHFRHLNPGRPQASTHCPPLPNPARSPGTATAKLFLSFRSRFSRTYLTPLWHCGDLTWIRVVMQ